MRRCFGSQKLTNSDRQGMESRLRSQRKIDSAALSEVEKSSAGFSLLEVIVSMAVLLTILLGLLHGLVLASRVFLLTEERFQSVLELWNQSQGLYQNFDATIPDFRPCPSCIPVHRSKTDSGDDSWEVVHGR